ncbi:MAG: glutamine amidotransferase [Aureliella sp.]
MSLEPVYGWYLVVPLTVIIVASLWLTLSSPGLTGRQRSILFSLRCLAMLLLVLGFLQPGFISEQTRETEGAVAVLMDRSQSMTLPSDSPGRSRWQLQASIWEELSSATSLEIGKTRIVPFFYDQNLIPANSDDLPGLVETFSKIPDGRMTDLGKALAEANRLQVDPPLRSIVIIGDGTQTATPAEIDPSVVARQMSQLDQPIYFIGVGNQGDQSRLKDVAIEGLPEQFSAFVKKELDIRLVVNAKGMQNQPIQLQLTLRASGREDRILASREVLASNPDQMLPQEFKIELSDPGEYLLEVTAAVDGEDQIESNNTALSFISVREGGAKILMVDGEPRFEQKFLKRAVDESLDFSLDRALLNQRVQKSARGGIDLGKDFQIDGYDAFIIGDLPAKALTRTAQDEIRKRVAAGGGILFMGGYQSFDAGGYGNSILDPLFPVQLSRRGFQNYDSPINRSFHIEDKITLIPKRQHPITNLGLPEPDNSRLWRSLPPLLGMNRFGRTKNAPGVQILLETQDKDAALIAGQFGNGRVLAFAGDTTWQWWTAGQKKAHQQFWRQVVLWLISRDSINEGFKLDLERRRLLIDETPKLQIDWFGGSDNKPMPTDIAIQLYREEETLQALSSSEDSADSRSAVIRGLDQPGLYRAELKAKGKDGTDYETEIAFVVRDESRELIRPDADWQMMKNIVASNDAAGGELFFADQVQQLVSRLQDRQDATKVSSIEKRRLGDGQWDSWLFLVLFCALMGVEWSLRKSWQLP